MPTFQDNTQASRLLLRAAGEKAFRVQDHFYQQARKAANTNAS